MSPVCREIPKKRISLTVDGRVTSSLMSLLSKMSRACPIEQLLAGSNSVAKPPAIPLRSMAPTGDTTRVSTHTPKMAKIVRLTVLSPAQMVLSSDSADAIFDAPSMIVALMRRSSALIGPAMI